MKKIISSFLASLILATAAVSCAPATEQLDPAITLASSDAQTKAEWLDNRLDEIPDHVIMGIGSSEEYGIDMTDFDDIGYIARAIDGDVLLFGKTADGLDRAVREYAKAVDADTVAELDTVYGEGAWIEELTIAEHDISEFTVVYTYEEDIVAPSSGSVTKGNAKYAATHLVRLIEQATGVTLPMQAEDVEGPMFKFDYITDVEPVGQDFSFNYEVKDGNVYINGMARSNGCAMGVYFFLENECGWDFLVYGDSELQEAESIDIPEGTACAMDPAFDYIHMRQIDYVGKMFNYENDRTDSGYISTHSKAGHSMYKYLEVEHSEAAVCYTSEETFSIVSENLAKEIASLVAVGRNLSETTISLGTDDTPEKCSCTACTKSYRTEGNAYSGALIEFANRIEEDMDARGYDGVKYAFYAYAGFNKPPRTVVPNYDIEITYCTDGNCYVHPADGSQCFGSSTNQGFAGFENTQTTPCALYMEWLAKWCEISSFVILYDYLLPNYFHEPTAIEHFYENLQWYKEIGVDGFGPEAEYVGLGLGRQRFKLWYNAIWHHDITKEEYEVLYDEVMRNEYGDGWDFVDDFIGIWQQTEKNLGCLSCWDFASVFADDQYDHFMYMERIEEMYQLLEKARLLANDELQEKNVERLLMLVIGNQAYLTYFDTYERNDTEAMELLEERWELMWQYAEHSQIAERLFVQGNTVWSQMHGLNRDLHKSAWNYFRGNYYYETNPTRPVPDWLTATTETTT